MRTQSRATLVRRGEIIRLMLMAESVFADRQEIAAVCDKIGGHEPIMRKRLYLLGAYLCAAAQAETLPTMEDVVAQIPN